MTNTIYCTYLTIYSGNKLPPLYIGSTSIEKINNGYRGTVSSKKYRSIWKSELAENPQSFETIILTYHSTREEALAEESCLQEQFDVVNSDLYINMAIANGKLIFCDHNDPEFRKKISEANKKRYENPEERKKSSESAKKGWTEEVKRQRSIDMKKRYESEEARKKTSESIKGSKRTEETKKKMSEAHKNRKPVSEETRKKLSEACRKRCESEEVRKKMSEAAKISWQIRKNIKK